MPFHATFLPHVTFVAFIIGHLYQFTRRGCSPTPSISSAVMASSIASLNILYAPFKSEWMIHPSDARNNPLFFLLSNRFPMYFS